MCGHLVGKRERGRERGREREEKTESLEKNNRMKIKKKTNTK